MLKRKKNIIKKVTNIEDGIRIKKNVNSEKDFRVTMYKNVTIDENIPPYLLLNEREQQKIKCTLRR